MVAPLIPMMLARLGPMAAGRLAGSARMVGGARAAVPPIAQAPPGALLPSVGKSAAGAARTAQGGKAGLANMVATSGGEALGPSLQKERQQREVNLKQMAKTGMKFGGAAGAAALLTVGLAKMNRGVVENARSLVMFNGSIAGSMAILKAERIGRKMELGARTAGGVQRATQAQSRLEEAMLPLSAAASNITSAITATAANAVSSILEGFNKLPVVGDMIEFFGNSKAVGEQNAARAFILEAAGMAENNKKAAQNRQFEAAAEIENAERRTIGMANVGTLGTAGAVKTLVE